jgi:hypothetical protein
LDNLLFLHILDLFGRKPQHGQKLRRMLAQLRRTALDPQFFRRESSSTNLGAFSNSGQ